MRHSVGTIFEHLDITLCLVIIVELFFAVIVYFILSRLLYLAFSANLGLLCMPHPGMGPLVRSEGRRSELFWSFIRKVAHPVSDRTQPFLTSVKLMGLAGPLGHSPRWIAGGKGNMSRRAITSHRLQGL